MVLKEMKKDGSLSSLVTVDCNCALKVIMIFSLVIAREEADGGLRKGRGREAKEMIVGVIDVLEGMEEVGFVKSVVGELPQRLERMGIKREAEDYVQVQENSGQSSSVFDANDSYSNPTTNLQGMDALADDAFFVDIDLFMDMDMDVSSMRGTGDMFQPDLDLFTGAFNGFDGM